MGCLPKKTEPYLDFRPVPEHNLLPEIKEIQWGHDNAIYFGPGLSEDERLIMRVLKSGKVPQENIDFYEECLGAKGPESFYDYSTQQHIVAPKRVCGDGSRRLAFSHPLREKALELKKYLTEKENAIGALKRYALETKKAEERLKIAQQELDALVNQNNLRRSELAASIEQKKADNNTEIENIRNDYNNALNEKKQAYDEYISDVREKCNNLRKEISNMEKQKEIETSKLEAFANEKLTAMANLEKESALYIENVKNKMDSIAAQQIALESAHSKRIATIKSQIASTMSDYDSLLRTRSKVVSDAVEDNGEELTNKAKAFRERLNALEESHKQILIDLDNKRNETLEKIASEIEELDASKPDKLKSYEDEIASISIAYDKMLRDEQNKQERINNLIKQAKKQQDEMLEENRAEYVGLEKDLVNARNEASSENKANIKAASDEFNATTASLKEEFDKLVAEKKNLSKNLANLADKFTRIDNEVFASTEELKDKYMSELLKVRQAFEENRVRKQKELSALDAMSGEVDDIFKNFN